MQGKQIRHDFVKIWKLRLNKAIALQEIVDFLMDGGSMAKQDEKCFINPYVINTISLGSY